MKKILFFILIFTISPSIFAENTGYASWYGGKFQGRKTANGEIFDTYKFTAAHKTLPFDTIIKIKNLENGKTTTVRINDRGPFIKGRIIDLSYAAAKELDMINSGVAKVHLEIIESNAEKTNKYIYKIQVAAFNNEQNARDTVKKLKTSGLKSIIEKNSSDVFRVVIKNIEKNKIERYKTILKKIGYKNYLIKKEVVL